MAKTRSRWLPVPYFFVFAYTTWTLILNALTLLVDVFGLLKALTDPLRTKDAASLYTYIAQKRLQASTRVQAASSFYPCGPGLLKS